MATNELKERILANPPGPFSPSPFYSRNGDFINFFWKNEDCYAHRMNNLVTIYLSFNNGEPVGCKIKGVQSVILGSLRKFFSKKIHTTTISILIVAGTALAGEKDEQPCSPPVLDRIGEATRDIPFDFEELDGDECNEDELACV